MSEPGRKVRVAIATAIETLEYQAELHGVDGAVDLATASRAHAATLREYLAALSPERGEPEQRCPVCEGHGFLNYPKGIAHDQPSFTASEAGPWPCHRCEGKGTLAPVGPEAPGGTT